VYQRTVLPFSSGRKGMAREANKGKRMMVVNQGKVSRSIGL
jgi:hypothetical protein